MTNIPNFTEPVYIVMEYASSGNLQQFLRDNRAPQKHAYTGHQSQTLTARDLTVFSLHVAAGMEYVSSKQVRKIAADAGHFYYKFS